MKNDLFHLVLSFFNNLQVRFSFLHFVAENVEKSMREGMNEKREK